MMWPIHFCLFGGGWRNSARQQSSSPDPDRRNLNLSYLQLPPCLFPPGEIAALLPRGFCFFSRQFVGGVPSFEIDRTLVGSRCRPPLYLNNLFFEIYRKCSIGHPLDTACPPDVPIPTLAVSTTPSFLLAISLVKSEVDIFQTQND